MLAVGLLAACGCTKREWALHRCFELMKGLEASQALLQTKTGEAKTWFGRQRALETLAMQSFDIIFDIDASERQVVVGTSRHVNLFFKQDMEGIPQLDQMSPGGSIAQRRSRDFDPPARRGKSMPGVLWRSRSSARGHRATGKEGEVRVHKGFAAVPGYSGESAPRAGVQTGARWPWT
ncbi:unnamed protein product [Effrenium voratum]|nr:unnamed protein product [Effrenium voratum]